VPIFVTRKAAPVKALREVILRILYCQDFPASRKTAKMTKIVTPKNAPGRIAPNPYITRLCGEVIAPGCAR